MSGRAHRRERPRDVAPLPPEVAARLRAVPATAPPTLLRDGLRPGAPVPHGYRRIARTVRLPGADLSTLGEQLFSWQVQRRAGLAVAASESPLRRGSVVEMRLGPRPVGLRVPCRVVDVIADPDRQGFTYVTLPGHPEAGVESFLLERGPDGCVRFTIIAVSRPGTLLTRLGSPASRAVQRLMTLRYLAALR